MKYLLPLFISLLFFSCGRNNRKVASEISDATITITVPAKQESSYNINEFVDSVSFIQLETTDENLMRNINQIWFHEDKMIVADNDRGSFFIYDSAGRYMNKIKKVGRGPGEYMSFASAMFDRTAETLIVYDINLKKMLFYTLGGEFVREIVDFSEGAIIREAINLPNGHFLCYAYDHYVGYTGADDRFAGLWEVDENGKYLRSLLTYDVQYPVLFNFLYQYFTLKEDGAVYLRDAIHSDIYEYRGDSLVKYIDYVFEDDRLTRQAGLREREKKYISAFNSQMSEDYIITRWSGVDKTFYSVYDIANNNFATTDSLNYIGSGFPVLRGLFVDTNRGDALVSQMNGAFMLYWMKDNVSLLPAGTRAVWEEMLEGKTENEIMDMNPILQIMYLKKK